MRRRIRPDGAFRASRALSAIIFISPSSTKPSSVGVDALEARAQPLRKLVAGDAPIVVGIEPSERRLRIALAFHLAELVEAENTIVVPIELLETGAGKHG